MVVSPWRTPTECVPSAPIPRQALSHPWGAVRTECGGDDHESSPWRHLCGSRFLSLGVAQLALLQLRAAGDDEGLGARFMLQYRFSQCCGVHLESGVAQRTSDI